VLILMKANNQGNLLSAMKNSASPMFVTKCGESAGLQIGVTNSKSKSTKSASPLGFLFIRSYQVAGLAASERRKSREGFLDDWLA
jgi:hypothetical protein